MPEEPVVTVDHVSKKFCRSLRRSLWYAVKDLAKEVMARKGVTKLDLRPAEFLAVDDVSFELRRGECLGLIGPNGAGKSTLLKILNGLIRPDAGRITIRGRVGALIELGTGFSPVLTGRENVYINGAVLGFSKREIDAKFDAIVDFAELRDSIDAPVQNYSSGMHVRLGMAIAVNMRSNLLLVDEVLAVGDIAFRMKCFQHFLELKKAGATIVVVSHNMIDINRVCDRAIVIEQGTKAYDGDVSRGIATYENHLLQRRGSSDQRAASGCAWIERVELLDAHGTPRGEFGTGDDLVAEVTISVVRNVPQARLIVHVETPSLGIVGAFSSPHNGFTFDLVPPAVVVRFLIRAMPLLVGGYNLRLNLYGAGIQDFLHSFTNAASFKIVGPAVDTFGYGVCHTVRFEHDWELGKQISCDGKGAVVSRNSDHRPEPGKNSDPILSDETQRWLDANRLERMDATVGIFDEKRREFHLDRYRFAAARVRGMRVLDCACGTGYGARLLREQGIAAQVIGIDVDQKTVEYARREHGVGLSAFICSSGDRLPLPDACVDAITSFETIEHVLDDVALVYEFYRVLRPGGLLIISTPNQWPLATAPFHVREYDRTSFIELLESRFECLELYNQNSGSDTPHNHDQPRGIVATTTSNKDSAECYIAICRRSECGTIVSAQP
jgi:lipopolysaccharide transport system ATP-binding protein